MIIAAALSERWSGAIFYKKKQREEDKRMKKKVLAFLLASTMVIEPFTVASAADFLMVWDMKMCSLTMMQKMYQK